MLAETVVLRRCSSSPHELHPTGMGEEEGCRRRVKAAFNNVSKAHLRRWMEALDLEPDLIRRTTSFMSGRQVKLVLGGEVGQVNPADAGIPQGSPAPPVLFITICRASLMKWIVLFQVSKDFPLSISLLAGREVRMTSSRKLQRYRSCRVQCCMPERSTLGGHQNSHGPQLYDAACAALARALETDAGRLTPPERDRSSQIPGLLSSARPRRNLAQARCMRYRLESTSRSFGEHNRTLPLRSNGVQPTRVLRGTRGHSFFMEKGGVTAAVSLALASILHLPPFFSVVQFPSFLKSGRR